MTAVAWARKSLFDGPFNTALTFLSLGLLTWAVPRLVRWTLGARWEVVAANLRLFAVGTYPADQLWRVGLELAALAALILASLWAWRGNHPLGRRVLVALWVLSVPGTVLVLRGVGDGALPMVRTTQWGGLLLTLVLAAGGIVLSFPFGVLLALGRQSRLPVVSGVCTLFIEVVRGVPLITVLFMAQVMVPVFLPDFRIDKVVRALMGITVFTAAYLAEDIRGGLQSIPRGQYEAAAALGLSGPQAVALVILPQALRAVIPAIVGQFISLFKDTSLVAVIGLQDLLGIARSVIANPRWLGLQPEVYVFAAGVYALFCSVLSRASQRLERRLGVGER
ncbi:amino acid ABC transporter permease [Limnochorda pilosa]|uniref:Amine acid ABC transporter permease n=1 Tax=Limnochorda pilosa TaxID=1555112 RepID=A0A0K2SHE0_LIMPI|nr:amino acid ABC transporter permease [Limnochorda pilosa]BAS26533.1 amine acid ABC transporter permease [Limnochorda pilosa]